MEDGEIIYEYDNTTTPLGKGAFGTVYEGTTISLFFSLKVNSVPFKIKGIRIEANCTESVAFKELRDNRLDDELLREKNIYEMMGHHGNQTHSIEI